MPLIHNTYGKGRVRVMRVSRTDGNPGDEHDEVSELSVQTMLDGGFSAAYTQGDNSAVVATDTIKNITYIVARENLTACPEVFGWKLATRLLDRYGQADSVTVTLHETRWLRAQVGGKPHPHSFVLDANGIPTAKVTVTRTSRGVVSGIRNFTFMKSTASGWVGFVRDDYTTLPETTDRLAATSMDARWTWLSAPDDYPATNKRVLDKMMETFATTYSYGIQDSLFRMGEAALAAVPELETVTMACPNKHYIPVDLGRFGLSADNMVFIPTDEPHGQIECTVGR